MTIETMLLIGAFIVAVVMMGNGSAAKTAKTVKTETRNYTLTLIAALVFTYIVAPAQFAEFWTSVISSFCAGAEGMC